MDYFSTSIRPPARSKGEAWDAILPQMAIVDSDPEPEVEVFLDSCSAQGLSIGIDVGCGMGRHTLAALNRRLRCLAVDASPLAVSETRRRLNALGAPSRVELAEMDQLPCESGSFDFLVSWCVLNHGTQHAFRTAVGEIARVLRQGGRAIACIMTDRDDRFGQGVEVAPKTFVFTEGLEAGVMHYFPSIDEVCGIFLLHGSVTTRESCLEGDAVNVYHPRASRSHHLMVEFCKA